MKKRYEIEQKILKWNKWIHIVLGFLTYFLWFLFLIIIFFDIKKSFESDKNDKKNSNNLVKEIYFKVAGITFENRQEIIKKMIKNFIKYNDIETYYNMTNKEIIESMDEIYEINDLKVPSLRLEPIEEDGNDAIEVYIKDFDSNQEYLMGYVPKNKLNEVMNFLTVVQNNPDYKILADAYFTGGKFKTSKYDEEKEKDIIVIDERNYGLNVNLKLYSE